jgi:uncharacterized cupin superfamily protein
MVEEARLEESESYVGVAPATDGWFVVNVQDSAWITNDAFGAACIFEGNAADFPHIGFTLGVIQPGQPSGLYHREANQEDFLVLSGECLLIVEEEERQLRAGDFVHCPPGTDHIFVGAGEGPCVIFMVGARTGWPDKGIVYPRSDLARRHGAGVEEETSKPSEAYAPFPNWRPGRPDGSRGVPWA